VAAPLNPADLDHAIELYLAGEPEAKIVSTVGVGRSALHRERTRRGIPPRREIALPAAEIAAAYLSGESEYSLGLRYGVSRNVIRRRLEQQCVPVRSMSEAGKVRAGQMTAEQRASQAAAAHDAVRGTKQPHERLIARAAQRQARGGCDSPGEQFLLDALRERGLDPVPQQAIDKYNVDLAVAPVAVEVLGGGWHLTKRHHATRTPRILDAGWHLVFIWNHEGDSALTSGAADYVVTFHDEVRRHPPTVGQYRVIAGSGKALAAGSRDDDEFALVPPPRGRLD